MTQIVTTSYHMFENYTMAANRIEHEQVEFSSSSILKLMSTGECIVSQWSEGAMPYSIFLTNEQVDLLLVGHHHLPSLGNMAHGPLSTHELVECCRYLQRSLQDNGITASCIISQTIRHASRMLYVSNGDYPTESETVRIIATIFEYSNNRILQRYLPSSSDSLFQAIKLLSKELLSSDNRLQRPPKGSLLLSEKGWATIEEAIGRGFCEQNICNGEIFSIENIGSRVLSKHIDIYRSRTDNHFDDEGLWSGNAQFVASGCLVSHLISLRQASSLSLKPVGGAMRNKNGTIEFDYSSIRIKTTKQIMFNSPHVVITDIHLLSINYHDLSCSVKLEYESDKEKFYWCGKISLLQLLSSVGAQPDGIMIVDNIEKSILSN